MRAPTPIIELSPPHKNPPLESPNILGQGRRRPLAAKERGTCAKQGSAGGVHNTSCTLSYPLRALLRFRAPVAAARGCKSTVCALQKAWRVSNAALGDAALVLSAKNWKIYSRWGAVSKNKSKKPWVCVFSLCCRAGIDAALVKADFFSAGVPTIENKIEQRIQNTKVASAKVAFDTVRKATEKSTFLVIFWDNLIFPGTLVLKAFQYGTFTPPPPKIFRQLFCLWNLFRRNYQKNR